LWVPRLVGGVPRIVGGVPRIVGGVPRIVGGVPRIVHAVAEYQRAQPVVPFEDLSSTREEEVNA